MASQTEVEKKISEIAVNVVSKKSILGDKLNTYAECIKVKTIINENKKKILVIMTPYPLLYDLQESFSDFTREIRQRFPEYFVFLIRNFNAEKELGLKIREKSEKSVQNAIAKDLVYPFLVTGFRTDVEPSGEIIEHVLLEKRTAFKKNEFELIEAALSDLTGKSFAVSINQHTLN